VEVEPVPRDAKRPTEARADPAVVGVLLVVATAAVDVVVAPVVPDVPGTWDGARGAASVADVVVANRAEGVGVGVVIVVAGAVVTVTARDVVAGGAGGAGAAGPLNAISVSLWRIGISRLNDT
jgi:hypothetical protein